MGTLKSAGQHGRIIPFVDIIRERGYRNELFLGLSRSVPN
jgi:hypothetical protein